MCPGTTKPLHELFLPMMHEVVWRVEHLGGGAVCGRMVIIALLHGLEWSVTICAQCCSMSFKDLLGCKRLQLHFDRQPCLKGSHSGT